MVVVTVVGNLYYVYSCKLVVVHRILHIFYTLTSIIYSVLVYASRLHSIVMLQAQPVQAVQVYRS